MPKIALDQLAERAESAWDELHCAQVYFWFDDLDASG